MSALLQISDLKVRFRIRPAFRALFDRASIDAIEAVAGVSLEIREGETFGLVGESGSGKTTLAQSIIGVVPVAGGTVRFAGREIQGLGPRAMKPLKREIAMMFQDPTGSLSPRLTVRSLITEPFRIHGLKGRDLDAECGRLLAMVGLPADFSGSYPHPMSG